MKRQKFTATKVLLIIFFAFAVVAPLLKMFSYMFEADVGKILADKMLLKSITNSLKVSTVSTLISITLAFALAWCMTRTHIAFKSIFSAIITLPMLVPSISHGMGLVILFGRNGSLTNLLGLNHTIYGFWGIVAGSVMYSLPVAYLMISDILRYEDVAPYEAAAVLGIPKINRMAAITAPYLRKPMISVIFATFTLIVTDYGVPVMVGGKYTTLPVIMYHEVIGRMNYSKGCVIGAILIIPALIAFIADFSSRDTKSQNFAPKYFEPHKSPLKDAASYAFLILTSITIIYPILSFAAITFAKNYPSDLSFTMNNVLSTLEKSAGEYLTNSIVISLFVALIGIIIAFACAYITARIGGLSGKALHLISIISLAIPGIVLGLSYVLLFNGSFIYGTIAILILVNIIHFFASPYLMIYNTLGKLNVNLEDVGLTLGIGKIRIVRDVIAPQSKSTLIEMFTYFFVNSMITISAVSFLATTANKPVSLMITQFQQQMLLEASAFVSLLILVVNIIIKAIAYIVKKKIQNKGSVNYVDKKAV